MIKLIKPFWAAPSNIVCGVSTLCGGVSRAPYSKLNLATHVGDSVDDVEKNRRLLNEHVRAQQNITSPLYWHWLNQTHSTTVSHLANRQIDKSSLYAHNDQIAKADASFTFNQRHVCVVLTADCLPILLADHKGRAVAAIHAGWRGLYGGVIENTISGMCDAHYKENRNEPPIKPKQLLAWLGPAIGPQRFEVGLEVKQAFLSSAFCKIVDTSLIEQAFTPTDDAKYLCNLYQLATLALNASGVSQVYGGGFCTVKQTQDFFSYRREKITGRMASFILINKHA